MGFIGQSYLKITLEPRRTQNLKSLLLKVSQSNFNLQSPDSDLVRSYLIATVLRHLKSDLGSHIFTISTVHMEWNNWSIQFPD